MRKKVLVVDDSAFMRKVIMDMINSSDALTVVDTAKNGEEAIEKIRALKPDLVTMDIEMPKMDGLTALKKIMTDMPLPVIMLSSLTKHGAQETLKALDLGAMDFITKPSSLIKVSAPEIKEELIAKLEAASKAKLSVAQDMMSHLPKSAKNASYTPYQRVEGKTNFRKLIAIGTSTGGPRALQDVIPFIPKDIDAGILIVQHMPPGFTKSLADRLNSMSQIGVKEAEDGDVMRAGWAYLAPGDSHIKVSKQSGKFVIKLDKGERVSGHRPSVDAMMYSIADLNERNVIGVIMTGMGADGADGMKTIKQGNNFVIAQDEDSCVVFGMPKSTIKLGVVDKVVSLSNIANEIVKAMEV
ncbi:protein-glutamate methylesterase/protein-glutamine glutaminase [Fusibacter sp. JL298sf-3]